MSRPALGIRLNNPGNLELGSPWQGLSDVQSHPRFCTFDHPKWGIRAIARTLITYQDKRRAADGSRIDSVQEIIDRWAPASDNNPSANYARSVASTLNVCANDETLDVRDYPTMYGLVTGIIRFENGAQPYDKSLIDEGLVLAGIEVPKKSLSDSRTIKASSAVAGASLAPVLAENVEGFKAILQPLAAYSGYAQTALLVITVAAAAYTVYARIDDRNKGAR
jgi:hypothetical protein